MKKALLMFLFPIMIIPMLRITSCGGIQYWLTEEEEAEFEQFVPGVIEYYKEKYEYDDVSVEHYNYLSPARDLFGGIVKSENRYFEMSDGFYVVWIDREGQLYDNKQADEIAAGLMHNFFLPKIEEIEEKYDITIEIEEPDMNYLTDYPYINVFHNKYCQDAKSFVDNEKINLQLSYVLFMDSSTGDYKTPMVEMGEFFNEYFNINVVEMFGCTSELGERFINKKFKRGYNSAAYTLFDSSVDAFCSYSLKFESEKHYSISVSSNNHWYSYFGSYDEYSLNSYWDEKQYFELFPSMDITPVKNDIILEEGDIIFEEILSQDELEEILLNYILAENTDSSNNSSLESSGSKNTVKSQTNISTESVLDSDVVLKTPITSAYKITFSDRFKQSYLEADDEALRCYFKFYPAPEQDKYSCYEVYKLTEKEGEIVISDISYTLNRSSIEHTYGCDKQVYLDDNSIYFICGV